MRAVRGISAVPRSQSSCTSAKPLQLSLQGNVKTCRLTQQPVSSCSAMTGPAPEATAGVISSGSFICPEGCADGFCQTTSTGGTGGYRCTKCDNNLFVSRADGLCCECHLGLLWGAGVTLPWYIAAVAAMMLVVQQWWRIRQQQHEQSCRLQGSHSNRHSSRGQAPADQLLCSQVMLCISGTTVACTATHNSGRNWSLHQQAQTACCCCCCCCWHASTMLHFNSIVVECQQQQQQQQGRLCLLMYAQQRAIPASDSRSMPSTAVTARSAHFSTAGSTQKAAAPALGRRQDIPACKGLQCSSQARK